MEGLLSTGPTPSSFPAKHGESCTWNNRLLCIAVYCFFGVLYYGELYCSVLYCGVLYCGVLYCICAQGGPQLGYTGLYDAWSQYWVPVAAAAAVAAAVAVAVTAAIHYLGT